jgi:hypothetical protein
MARLPVDKRGYPVPWFTAYFDGEPDFRVLDPVKLTKAVQERRCWVCGEKMGAFNYFVISPLCAVDRTSTEPPSHEECAEFAARACPFLTRPAMRRRTASLPEESFEAAGVVIDHSPGVVLVWATLSYNVRRIDNGVDFAIGEPMSCRWYAEGRKARREDLVAAIESLPAPGLSAEKAAGLLRLFERSG